MNVVSDMEIRLNQEFPATVETEELSAQLKLIENQGKEIEKLQAKIAKLEAAAKPAKKAAEKKPAAKKAPAKKAAKAE
jgi:alpha-amylase